MENIYVGAIYYGDAALATLRLLEILESTGKQLSELVSELPSFYMKKIAINCLDEIKKLKKEKIYSIPKDLCSISLNISSLGGDSYSNMFFCIFLIRFSISLTSTGRWYHDQYL